MSYFSDLMDEIRTPNERDYPLRIGIALEEAMRGDDGHGMLCECEIVAVALALLDQAGLDQKRAEVIEDIVLEAFGVTGAGGVARFGCSLNGDPEEHPPIATGAALEAANPG